MVPLILLNFQAMYVVLGGLTPHRLEQAAYCGACRHREVTDRSGLKFQLRTFFQLRRSSGQLINVFAYVGIQI